MREHPFDLAGSKHDNSTSRLDQNAVSTLKMCGRNKDDGRPVTFAEDSLCDT